jgi:hypothetical protein
MANLRDNESIKSYSANENKDSPIIEQTNHETVKPKIEDEKGQVLPVIEIKPEPEVKKLEPVLKDKPLLTKNQLETVSEEIEIEPLVSEKLETPILETVNEVINPPLVETPSNPVFERSKEEVVTELKKQLNHPIFDAPKFVPISEKQTPIIPPPKRQEVQEKSVLDKISEEKIEKTLHETISTKKDEKELFHGFANSRITKIKDAIDISKRFEIQTRLFGEDSNAYNISINELENAGNIENALKLFTIFTKRYHWDENDELMQELKSFLHRKY